jgi:hypothetical protein
VAPRRSTVRTVVEWAAALLVALGATLLLTSAAAYAECAWVLWDIEAPFPPNAGPTMHSVDSAHETRKACESLANEKGASPWNKSTVDRFVRFVCLPDTVDPRSPKAR